ncbi:MAG: type II secretion system protein GspM [Hyphomicrobium sp.]
MMSTLIKPVRQFAALALLASVLAGFGVFVVAPFAAQLSALATGLQNKREILGRLNDFSRDNGEALALQARLKSRDVESLVLTGSSDALKAARLQTALSDMAATHSLRLRSTRALTPRTRDTLRLIGVEAGFEASLEQLQAILLAIDAHQPVMVVSQLHIAAAPAVSLDATASGAVLDITLEVLAAAGPDNPETGKAEKAQIDNQAERAPVEKGDSHAEAPL